jgi:tetratricopeptide (TPR) repeat protein
VVLDAEPEQTSGGLGTPEYRAPEQAPPEPAHSGQAPPAADRIDRRTDVFGLGALLYELLTGSAPHAAAPGEGKGGTRTSREQRWERVRRGQVVPVRARAPWVDRALEAVCLKALAPRPEDRYSSATELADEVRRWLSGEPVRAEAALAEAAALRRQLRFRTARTLLEHAKGAAQESGNEELQERQRRAEADLNMAALRDWLSWEPERERRLRLLEVSQRIDPGVWPEEVAEAVRSGNKGRLRRLMAEATPGSMPPASAVALARLAGLSAPESRRVLCLARERHPDDFWLHFTVGLHFWGDPNTRPDEQGLQEAVASYRAALAVKPDSAAAQSNLGSALYYKGDLGGAVRCYREAARLDPGYAAAYSNLAAALREQGDVGGAVRCCREAIRLDPRLAMAHTNLGHAFREQGDFSGARPALERALTLWPPSDPLVRVTQALLARCKQGLETEQRLRAVLAGKASPRDGSERLALGSVAVLPAQQHFATAARLFREALADQRSLADGFRAGHRYKAACAAALAGCGRGKDSGLLGGSSGRRESSARTSAPILAFRQPAFHEIPSRPARGL